MKGGGHKRSEEIKRAVISNEERGEILYDLQMGLLYCRRFLFRTTLVPSLALSK